MMPVIQAAGYPGRQAAIRQPVLNYLQRLILSWTFYVVPATDSFSIFSEPVETITTPGLMRKRLLNDSLTGTHRITLFLIIVKGFLQQ